MCQAYESERSFVIAIENAATRAGFFARLRGKSLLSNPHDGKYFERSERENWDHGWHCAEQRMLPWAIESKIRETGRSYGEGLARAEKVQLRLERTGKVPIFVYRLFSEVPLGNPTGRKPKAARKGA